jgi:hypothetical protein
MWIAPRIRMDTNVVAVIDHIIAYTTFRYCGCGVPNIDGSKLNKFPGALWLHSQFG